MTRSLFSQSWHSVAELKPRLLPGARIHRHVYRGEIWYVVQDQAGGRYHRFSGAAHAMIMRMDGAATVQSLWDEACRDAPEEIPTQNEVVDLLIQLHAADLLQVDIPPDAATLFERYKKRRDQTWKQWLMNPMSLKLPLLDPDRFLGRWSGRLAWLIGWKGAALWLAVVVPAAFLAAQHSTELTANLSDRVLAAKNIVLMALVFPFVKALHELGHGFATRIWGGSVHEMGIMFLVFAPMPYVEASAASAFPSKYRRAVVGAAGMLVEVFLAALALYVWLAVEPGLARALAFNVMLVAGISTLIVNGNPLLRYDAYYILSDLIEMPNLAQRGQRYLTYLWDRHVFKAREADAPAESASEKRWLVCYTIASWCYRVLITVSIILFIASEFFIFGTLLALWGAFTLLAMPIWKAARHVLQSPALHRRRTQAIRLSLALTAALVFFVCVVPMPMRTLAEGVVWLPEQALLRAGGNGVFQRWLVEPGTLVERGTSVLALEDPLLAAELAVAQAKVEEALARYRIEQFANSVKAEISRQQLEHEQRVLERTAERFARLIVRAQADGVLIVSNPQDMAGRFFKKGELLGYALDRKLLIARVVVTQDNIDLVRTKFRSVELRLAEAIADTHATSVIREVPGGVDELPTAALGASGGGSIAVDPKDSNGVKTLERVFIFDLQLPPGAMPKAFGERVHVRFNHGGEPLFAQGYRRVRQLFLSRFNV
jgi:putative peptide zinc metalloprotease protein